jgi:hypothetical protein
VGAVRVPRGDAGRARVLMRTHSGPVGRPPWIGAGTSRCLVARSLGTSPEPTATDWLAPNPSLPGSSRLRRMDRRGTRRTTHPRAARTPPGCGAQGRKPVVNPARQRTRRPWVARSPSARCRHPHMTLVARSRPGPTRRGIPPRRQRPGGERPDPPGPPPSARDAHKR